METQEAINKRVEMIKKRETAVKIAWAYLGKPYRWGGDDPIIGFDCSGFVIEILKSVGLLPRKGDWPAKELYKKFKPVQVPYEGCLVFWGDPIIHVEFCLDEICRSDPVGADPQPRI